MQVFVLVLDALPLGFLGAYGNDWIESPGIDRLAARGVTFDRCYPNRPGPWGWLRECADWPIPLIASPAAGDSAALPMEAHLLLDQPLPDALASRFAPWPVETFIDPPIPESELIAIDEVLASPHVLLPPINHPLYGELLWEYREAWTRDQMGDSYSRPMERLLARATELLTPSSTDVRTNPRTTQAKSKSRLVIARISAFSPSWLPPADQRQKFIEELDAERSIYGLRRGLVGDLLPDADLPALRAGVADQVHYVDGLIEELLEHLEEAGRLDETAILLTADNGLAVGEHSALGSLPVLAYEEFIHVPLLVAMPGGRRGARSAQLAQSVDLGPTLAAMLEVPPPDAAERVGGRSWLPALAGERQRLREYAVSTIGDRSQTTGSEGGTGRIRREHALVAHQWKLILDEGWGRFDGKPEESAPRARELFIKPEDRWDANDVADSHPEILDTLELQLRRQLAAADVRHVLPMRPLQ